MSDTEWYAIHVTQRQKAVSLERKTAVQRYPYCLHTKRAISVKTAESYLLLKRVQSKAFNPFAFFFLFFYLRRILSYLEGQSNHHHTSVMFLVNDDFMRWSIISWNDQDIKDSADLKNLLASVAAYCTSPPNQIHALLIVSSITFNPMTYFNFRIWLTFSLFSVSFHFR